MKTQLKAARQAVEEEIDHLEAARQAAEERGATFT